MKCKECNYAEPIVTDDHEHSGNIRCKITREEHAPFFTCNCEHTRVKRDKEARLLNDKKAAEESLVALMSKLSRSTPDIEYVYRTLHEIREEVESDKLEGLIQYLEAYM